MQTYHQKCGQTGKVFAGARYLMITLLIGCVVSLPTTALARGKGQNFTRTYVGTIDGAPIRMKLQRRGEILSGTYAYVRAGVTLHLQGVTDGDHLKLIEIYGKN